MYSIAIILSTLTLSCTCVPARTPRIYNVLISSKKNLSPSHALPVYEPVLRTTSLGYAFPPLLYNTPFGGIPTIVNTHYATGPAILPEIQTNPVLEQATGIRQEEGNFQQADFIGARTSRLQETVKSPSVLQEENSKLFKNEQQSGQAVQTLPVENFIPYSPLLRNYAPYLPKELQEPEQNQNNQHVNDPKHVIANLKKNSDIPDVPPPPLPVKA